MKILLSNDDGVNAPGLLALCEELSAIADLLVVSTTEEKSGYSHAITLERPLRAQEFLLGGRFPAHVLNGTPADCVKFGLQILAGAPPDMIISGINLGSNSGLNIHYSGTVAAAKEGAICGVLSLAVSLKGRKPEFEHAARLTRRLAPQLHARFGKIERPPAPLFNLNVPRGPVRGIRLVRHSFGRFVDLFHKREDPRGKTYYWLNGDESIRDPGEDHDDWGLDQGYATLTPLRLDMTDREILQQMQDWNDLTEFAG
jgi:5'/3'-nucleotidase